MRIVDLSHPIIHGMTTYPGLPGPSITPLMDHAESATKYDPPTRFHIGRVEMITNTGTYVDVPFHRYEKGDDLASFPLERLVNLDLVVIDHPAHTRVIDAIDLGSVSGKAVLFRTGWSARWGTPEYTSGPYPHLAETVALELVDAGAILVGIDSLNVDDNTGGSRPAHSILLAAGIPILEHLTNLAELDGPARLFAAPPAIHAAGSFPVRAFALVG